MRSRAAAVTGGAEIPLPFKTTTDVSARSSTGRFGDGRGRRVPLRRQLPRPRHRLDLAGQHPGRGDRAEPDEREQLEVAIAAKSSARVRQRLA